MNRLTASEMLVIDDIVCRGLGKRPQQTIRSRALELITMRRRNRTPLRVLRACELLTREGGDEWARMAAAAALLKPLVT
ncbi:MAG TPA: hypothetical protein VMI75_03520 [Polyangiaceae bacterium]|nr:hypothetical protein [Polyangiaceae bacterium]